MDHSAPSAVADATPLATVFEVVTFKLKPGVTAAQFKPVDQEVEVHHA